MDNSKLRDVVQKNSSAQVSDCIKGQAALAVKLTATVKIQKATQNFLLKPALAPLLSMDHKRIEGASELKSFHWPSLGIFVAFLSSFYHTWQCGVCAT